MSAALGVAAGSAALAACLLPRPGSTATPLPGLPARRGAVRTLATGGLLVLVAAVVGLPAEVIVLAAIGAAATLALGAWWQARQAQALARRTAAGVLEACEQLAGELATGQPPGTALARLGDSWPLLQPVAEAFRVGAEVPEAFRVAARQPGAADLVRIGAAWQVAHRTGQGLADAVDRVAVDLRAARATARVVEGELASARATARLVALLPVLALTMGSGAGGDPWAFLLTTTVGLACLAGGLGLGLVGLWWIEALARDVDRPS